MAEKPDNVGEKALAVVNQSRVLVIKTNEDYERAQEIRGMLLQYMSNLDEAFDDLKDAAHKAWKKIVAKKDHYYKPVKDEATFLKTRMGEYKIQKERERELAQQQATAEAVKQAEEQRLQEAIANPEIADQILEAPLAVAPVILPKDVPAGTTFRTIWDFEVYDFDMLIKAVANGQVANIALLPNDKFLRQQATSFKDQLLIPGVKATSRLV